MHQKIFLPNIYLNKVLKNRLHNINKNFELLLFIDDSHHRIIVSNSYERVALAILSTLVACLPNESKELLNENEICIPTPTSRPPLFNYATFCKVLSIYKINEMIDEVLNKQSIIPRPNSQEKWL